MMALISSAHDAIVFPPQVVSPRHRGQPEQEATSTPPPQHTRRGQTQTKPQIEAACKTSPTQACCAGLKPGGRQAITRQTSRQGSRPITDESERWAKQI